jgi:hypothetical protein
MRSGIETSRRERVANTYVIHCRRDMECFISSKRMTGLAHSHLRQIQCLKLGLGSLDPRSCFKQWLRLESQDPSKGHYPKYLWDSHTGSFICQCEIRTRATCDLSID